VDLMFYILQLVNIPKYIIKLRIAKSLRLFCFNINEKNVFEKNDVFSIVWLELSKFLGNYFLLFACNEN
jgi:hypothetical protein